jgi:CRISPR-associated endonuclease Cas1
MNALSSDSLAERGRDYAASAEHNTKRYAQWLELSKQRDRCLILTGYGVSLRVERDGLVLQDGCLSGDTPEPQTLERGIHRVATLILLDPHGSLTFDSLRWCREQGITLILLGYDGEVVTTIRPDGEPSSATLRRAQYQAADSPAGVSIAQDLVRRKLTGQRATLNQYFPHADAHETLDASRQWLDRSPTVAWLNSLETLRSLEGRCASAYFRAWQDMPLRWDKTARKRIPDHWLTYPGRASALASWENAQNATHPTNAILNYAYALLQAQAQLSLLAHGFDLGQGFLHAPRRKVPSLVYDLMECARGDVDAVVLAFIRATTLSVGDFIKARDGSVRLHPAMARLVVAKCRIRQSVIDGHTRAIRDLLIKECER